MKKSVLNLLVFSVALALACKGAAAQVAVNSSSFNASKILEESYSLSKNLVDQDRAIYLVRLTNFSTIISPNRTETWAGELFELAPKLPPTWDRVATAKNALVPLSRVNPILAFNLLSKVEKPIPQPREGFTEDVRADAAATIFPNYFRAVGPADLTEMLKTASAIGESGEFPYRAMGIVIEEISKTGSGTDSANKIFSTALEYYSKKSDFKDANSQFLQLLQRSESAVSPKLFLNGLKQFVDKITKDGEAGASSAYLAQIQTAEGIFPVSSENQMLLFRAFPMIVRANPTDAAKLIKSHPVLAHADADVQSVLAHVIEGDITQVEPSKISEQLRQELLFRRVGYFQHSDPELAFKEAHLLTTPAAQIQAVSSIMPSLVRSNPEVARDAYAQIKDAWEGMPEDDLLQRRQKLKSLIAVVKAAYHAQDSKGFSDLMSLAFDTGIQMLSSNSSGEPLIYRRPGYNELLDFADFAGENAPVSILKKVRSVQDQGVRAYLLLYVARGVDRSTRVSAGN